VETAHVLLRDGSSAREDGLAFAWQQADPTTAPTRGGLAYLPRDDAGARR